MRRRSAAGSEPGRPLGAALGEPGFRCLWLGQSLSAVGDQMFPVAIAVLALDRGGGASVLGLILAARVLATIVFLVLGGVLADRWRRTWTMAMVDSVRAITVVGLAFTPSRPSAWTLAALTFVLGAGEAFFRPAYGALVPSLLPTDLLQSGNAITAVSERVATVLGPALAGVFLSTLGVRATLLADAATFVVSLSTLLATREPSRENRAVAASILRDARDGLRAVLSRRWIVTLVSAANVQVVFGFAPTLVLLPIIARSRLGGNGSYSVILTAFGVGSVLGAFRMFARRPRRPGVVALLSMLPLSAAMLSLVVSESLAVVSLAFAAAGFGLRVFSVLWVTALQLDVPGALLGRVLAFDRLGSMALMPIAFALTGPAVEAFGTGPVLVVGSAVVVAMSLLPLGVRGVAELTTPRDPSRPVEPDRPDGDAVAQREEP